MKTRLAVTAVVLVAGTGSGIYAHQRDELHPLPVLMQAPTQAATGLVVHRGGAAICRLDTGVTEPPHGDIVSGQVWVDPHPDGGVALWLPGLNSPCRSTLTQLSAARAEAFADAVEHAPPTPSGVYACPMDDGSRVMVFLNYPGRTDSEAVLITLTGCTELTAPGRDDRQSAGAVAALGPVPRGMH